MMWNSDITFAFCLGYVTTSFAISMNGKSCQDYQIPVTVTSLNFQYGLAKFQDNYDVVDFISNFANRVTGASTALYNPFSGAQNQTGTYKIYGTLCVPTDVKASHKTTVLLATHGLNWGKGYWASTFSPEKYSFVDYAISKGYSVFYYDRLGVGGSTIISGFVNQGSIQVAILRQLILILRAGRCFSWYGVPKKVVLVGHSFGSYLSAAVLAAEPTLADGLILTGFSSNAAALNFIGLVEAAQPRIASTQNNSLWSKLDNGYLTTVDKYSTVNAFFKKPDYDSAVIDFVDSIKQPFAILELLSIGVINAKAVDFLGPTMIIAGQYDFIFCTGQCDDVITHPATEIFSKASSFKAISYPGAGHALNFASNAAGVVDTIIHFLVDNGI